MVIIIIIIIIIVLFMILTTTMILIMKYQFNGILLYAKLIVASFYFLISCDRDYVKRLLSLSAMRNKLQNHEYCTMASFDKDFYELLNNGRLVTMEGSQVRIRRGRE